MTEDLNRHRMEQQKAAQSSVVSEMESVTAYSYSNDGERKKRSLGLIASLFNRIMLNEVQDPMVYENEEDLYEDDVIKLVKCELVIEKKSCTTLENKTVCKNYFQPQCFLYAYPRSTITIKEY